MATVIASTFFLLGTVLLYAVTGMLNIDDLIGRRNADHRSDRLRRADVSAGLPAHRAEAVSGEWLGARCL